MPVDRSSTTWVAGSRDRDGEPLLTAGSGSDVQLPAGVAVAMTEVVRDVLGVESEFEELVAGGVVAPGVDAPSPPSTVLPTRWAGGFGVGRVDGGGCPGGNETLLLQACYYTLDDPSSGIWPPRPIGANIRPDSARSVQFVHSGRSWYGQSSGR